MAKQLSQEHLDKLAEGRRKRTESRSNSLAVTLGKTLRIFKVDSHNWVLQKLTGQDSTGSDIWVSQAYYPTLKDCLSSTAKKLLDGSLAKASATPVSISELKNLIETAEQNVLTALKNLSADIGEDNDPS